VRALVVVVVVVVVVVEHDVSMVKIRFRSLLLYPASFVKTSTRIHVGFRVFSGVESWSVCTLWVISTMSNHLVTYTNIISVGFYDTCRLIETNYLNGRLFLASL
jgi:hypothetical protein